MFLDIDLKDKESIAAIDDEGIEISYKELIEFSDEFYSNINCRTLIFVLSKNCIGSLAGYVASMKSKIVPLILNTNIEINQLNNLIRLYQPAYLWIPDKINLNSKYVSVFKKYDYVMLRTGLHGFELNNSLSLLLSTSGSTGSPKLVRHSYKNIHESAKNVSKIFELSAKERAIAVLPLNYTMGLSVVNSHLYSGAIVLLTNKTLSDKSFWNFIKNKKGTSFTGVPFSYEFLSRIGFFKMQLPDLKMLAQGGGKLNDELFKCYTEFAEKNNKKFMATYGQTEGTGRMTYLPSEMAVYKTGSIGKALPNSRLEIIDKNGNLIHDVNANGELVYYGSNVTLGYAHKGEDLTKGDENKGKLKTGDIVRRDKDGYYYIMGRINRFLKINGTRISLDHLQQLIKSKYNTDCVCKGTDEKMIIFLTNKILQNDVSKFIVQTTRLSSNSFQIITKKSIRRNEYGKVIYY